MSQQSHLRSVDSHDGGEPKGPSRAQQRQRAGRPLPTDRMKTDLQVKVLHAIGRLSGPGKTPVTAQDLSRSVGGLAPTTVILSNKFFADAGWIDNDNGKYAATDALVDYTRRRAADGHGNVSPETMESLRVPVRQSWFWQALSPYLASGELPVKEARIILSREADAGEGHMPSIMNVLWWLAFVGLIIMDNDQVRLNGSQPADAGTLPAGQPAQPAAAGTSGEKPADRAGEPSPAYVVAFSLDVRMTMDDLARLSPDQVKALFESVGTVMALSSAKG